MFQTNILWVAIYQKALCVPAQCLVSPDLVILDVNPVMADDRQLCEQIGNIETYQHLPVIVY
jgi:CheY-like chemotaxis protein